MIPSLSIPSQYIEVEVKPRVGKVQLWPCMEALRLEKKVHLLQEDWWGAGSKGKGKRAHGEKGNKAKQNEVTRQDNESSLCNTLK